MVVDRNILIYMFELLGCEITRNARVASDPRSPVPSRLALLAKLYGKLARRLGHQPRP